MVPWRDLEAGSTVPLPAEGAGFGIKTGARPSGSGIIVVDLDGEAAVESWLELGGADETPHTVSTPRGLHLYFIHPGFPVRNSAGALAKGIDIRGDGGFVVGPGSPHRSGDTYELVHDCPLTTAPTWLLDWLRKQPAPAEVQKYEGDVAGVERERRRELYASWLANDAKPCVQGEGGDSALFQAVQYGAYDLALPSEDVAELIAEHFDPRCSPPWGDELEERVLHKAHDAKTKSTRPRIAPLLAQEEEALAELLEPTRLTKPEDKNLPPDDFGFKIKWGGWASPPIPPKYLVDGLLVESKVSMIFAEPGTIKSWTAIDIAASVAEGLPWLGERAVEQGRVLYVDFEDGEHEFHRRVWLLTGRQDRKDLGYAYAPGSINEKEWWVRLEKMATARGVKFVVIDTLAGGTVGTDENDVQASAPLTYAGWFTEMTKATVLVLHHANKSGDIRGTSAFKANVDTLFKLESLSDENGVHKAKLTCIKSGQKKVFPIHLELTDEGLTTFEPPNKTEAEDEKVDKRTLDQIQQEVLLMVESEGPFASVQKLRERVKASQNTVNAVLSELSASGEVWKSPEGWRRDNESLRRRRLQDAVQKNPTFGMVRLTALAIVSKPFWEQCRAEGRLRPRVVGDETSGWIWVEV